MYAMLGDVHGYRATEFTEDEKTILVGSGVTMVMERIALRCSGHSICMKRRISRRSTRTALAGFVYIYLYEVAPDGFSQNSWQEDAPLEITLARVGAGNCEYYGRCIDDCVWSKECGFIGGQSSLFILTLVQAEGHACNARVLVKYTANRVRHAIEKRAGWWALFAQKQTASAEANSCTHKEPDSAFFDAPPD